MMPLTNCMNGAMCGSYILPLTNVLFAIIHPDSKRSNTDLYKYILNTHVLENVDVVRDLGVHVDCLLKFDRHISLIVHKAMTRARLILRCFLSCDRQLLFKAYCVYVRPLLEYCSAVWSPHFKFLMFKIESVQRFFTKRLQGMWRQGYDDRLRLLNTHSLKYRRLYVFYVSSYSVIVSIHSLPMFLLNQLKTELDDMISNLLNKLALWMPQNITLQIG